METTLEECEVGDTVILWCIGWGGWDNESVEIVDKGIRVDVKYATGSKLGFVASARCKLIGSKRKV